MAYLSNTHRIETALCTLEWAITIRNVTTAAFANEPEARAYLDNANRDAGEREPIAHLWRIDHENDLTIRQIDRNYPGDLQYAGLRAEG